MPETEFEQRVADEVTQLAGPSRPVDARVVHARVIEEVSAHRRPTWGRRPSLAAAAAALALGLGLVALLGTLSTAPPDRVGSTSSREARGPDLDTFGTEVVEPGVLHIVDDGAGHQLTGNPKRALAIGREGEAWVLTLDETISLGHDQLLPPLPVRYVYGWPEAMTDSEGTLWGTWCEAAPFALEDGDWIAHPVPESGCVSSLWLDDDGVVWGALPVVDGAGPRIARWDGDAWTLLPTVDDPGREGSFGDWFAATSESDVWFANGLADGHGTSPRGLLHYDGTSWSEVMPAPDDPAALAGPLALGPDGTLWVFLQREERDALGTRSLARLDAGSWEVFGAAEGVPNMLPSGRPVVDRDGRLWMGLADLGVASFDGATWGRYLDGSTVRDLALAGDGRIWVMTESEVYVIDPRATADQRSKEVPTPDPSPLP